MNNPDTPNKLATDPVFLCRQEIGLVDENPVDNMIHSRMLELMCTKNKVVTYPNMKYALNDLTKRLKQNEPLPGLFLVSIDFRNTLEFIRFYQEM